MDTEPGDRIFVEKRGKSRLAVPWEHSIRVLAKNGRTVTGTLSNIHDGGFLLISSGPLRTGSLLEGVIEIPINPGHHQLFPFIAQCMWHNADCGGFEIKEFPFVSPEFTRNLIDRLTNFESALNQDR